MNLLKSVTSIIPVLFLVTLAFSQESQLKQLHASITKEFDFSENALKEWEQAVQLLSSNKNENDFTDDELKLFDKYDVEFYQNIWDVGGIGCSFYCGAGAYVVRTSSFLSSQGKNAYSDKNLKDFNYKTAWVEGVEGYGIGEVIEFDFAPDHPRVTSIIIANGYVKSKTAWENNSRVKKLKMYLNDTPYAILNLLDKYAEQSFEVSPLGNSDREDYEKLKNLPPWKLKFEILEVYEGKKYKDTAISEFYFDGIDVH